MGEFRFDPEWLSEELFKNEAFIGLLVDGGEAVEAEARRLAGQYNRSGDFQRSIQGGLFFSSNGRPFYRIWSDDPAAWSIEFGTAKDKAHRVLGRAIGKWGDVNTLNYENSKRRRKSKVEKSISAWVVSVRKGG